MVLESGVVRVQRCIVGVFVFGWGVARDEACALGPQPDARGVDEQRAAGQRLGAGEVEHRAAPRVDGQIDAQPLRHRARPGTGGIDHGAACQAFAVGQVQRADVLHAAAGLRVHAHGLGLHIARALGLGLAAQGLQQAVAVEPALAGQAQRAQRDTVGREPGEAFAELPGCEQGHIGAHVALGRMVVA